MKEVEYKSVTFERETFYDCGYERSQWHWWQNGEEYWAPDLACAMATVDENDKDYEAVR